MASQIINNQASAAQVQEVEKVSTQKVVTEEVVTTEKVSPEEVISNLLYRKYKECIVIPTGLDYYNKSRRESDFVIVIGKKDCINKQIYFNYIDKIDNMKINMVKVSTYTATGSMNAKNTKKCIGRVSINIKSESIRIVDRYQQSEDMMWDEDDATTCLYSNELIDYSNKKIKELSYKDIKEVVEKVTFTINNLEFDKFSGSFVLKSEKESRESEITAYKTLFKCQTISLKIGECVVCMDDTKTTTHCCGQNLCYYCWDKIKALNTEDLGFPDSKLPCPNCRKDLRYDIR